MGCKMKDFENLTVKEYRESIENMCSSIGRKCGDCPLESLRCSHVMEDKTMEVVLLMQSDSHNAYERVRRDIDEFCKKVNCDECVENSGSLCPVGKVKFFLDLVQNFAERGKRQSK